MSDFIGTNWFATEPLGTSYFQQYVYSAMQSDIDAEGYKVAEEIANLPQDALPASMTPAPAVRGGVLVVKTEEYEKGFVEGIERLQGRNVALWKNDGITQHLEIAQKSLFQIKLREIAAWITGIASAIIFVLATIFAPSPALLYIGAALLALSALGIYRSITDDHAEYNNSLKKINQQWVCIYHVLYKEGAYAMIQRERRRALEHEMEKKIVEKQKIEEDNRRDKKVYCILNQSKLTNKRVIANQWVDAQFVQAKMANDFLRREILGNNIPGVTTPQQAFVNFLKREEDHNILSEIQRGVIVSTKIPLLAFTEALKPTFRDGGLVDNSMIQAKANELIDIEYLFDTTAVPPTSA